MENNTMNMGAQPQAQPQMQTQPQMPGVASAPVSNNQGGTKKSSSILTIVFLITTLGFAGAFAWAMLRDNGKTVADKTSEKCVVTQSQVDNAEEGTIGDIVANYDSDKEVKELVREMITYLGTRSDTVSPREMTVDGSVASQKVDDDLYTRIKKGYGIMVVLNDFDKVYSYTNAVKEFLTSKGFSLNEEFSLTDYMYAYDKGDLRCMVSANSSPFTAGCTNLTWLSESEKALVRSLYDAYVAAKGPQDDKVTIIADASDIKDSKNGKFETLTTSVIIGSAGHSGFAGLFYREKGSDSWIFFAGTQAPLPCDGYAGDAKEAFAGDSCVMNGGYDLGTVGGE